MQFLLKGIGNNWMQIMAHAIFVGDVSSIGIRNMTVLAYDIPRLGDAESLVRGLAGSYAEHGLEASTGAYWFKDGRGIHKIWARPVV